jgi:hypothetical protein
MRRSPDWAKISAIIDVDSFVKYYFVFELGENPEITQSSVYFYKDGPDGKLFAGPIWDFDSAFAQYDKTEPYGADYRSEYVKNAQILRGSKGNGWMMELFRNTAFVRRANADVGRRHRLPVSQARRSPRSTATTGRGQGVRGQQLRRSGVSWASRPCSARARPRDTPTRRRTRR